MRASQTRGSQGSVSQTRLVEKEKSAVFRRALAPLSANEDDGVEFAPYDSLSNPEIQSRAENSQVSPSMIIARQRRHRTGSLHGTKPPAIRPKRKSTLDDNAIEMQASANTLHALDNQVDECMGEALDFKSRADNFQKAMKFEQAYKVYGVSRDLVSDFRRDHEAAMTRSNRVGAERRIKM